MFGRRKNLELVWRDELTVQSWFHDDEWRFTLRRRDFGGDLRTGDAGAHVVESIVDRHAQHLVGEPAAVESPCVSPDESSLADDDSGRDAEQAGDEISGEVRAGRPARTPETDVAHDASPSTKGPCAHSTPLLSRARAPWRLRRTRDRRMACAASG